jgi:hypothetical protein
MRVQLAFAYVAVAATVACLLLCLSAGRARAATPGAHPMAPIGRQHPAAVALGGSLAYLAAWLLVIIGALLVLAACRRSRQRQARTRWLQKSGLV